MPSAPRRLSEFRIFSSTASISGETESAIATVAARILSEERQRQSSVSPTEADSKPEEAMSVAKTETRVMKDFLFHQNRELQSAYFTKIGASAELREFRGFFSGGAEARGCSSSVRTLPVCALPHPGR